MKYLKKNETTEADNDPLTSKIIGIAIDVHRELGPGFPESVYHRALELEFARAKISFVSEAPLTVIFRDHVLGNFNADFVIEDRLLIELKALETLPLISEVQVVSYLKASGLSVGLLLNFGASPLQIKRKYRNCTVAGSDLRLQEA